MLLLSSSCKVLLQEVNLLALLDIACAPHLHSSFSILVNLVITRLSISVAELCI